MAGWLQLSPLVEVQKNLRLLRREVKAAAESTTEQNRLTGILRNETAQAVQAWDEAAVLGFVNAKVIAPLDPGLDGRLAMRTVTVGSKQASEIEIIEGISPGDSVVVSGPANLRDGQRVKVKE